MEKWGMIVATLLAPVMGVLAFALYKEMMVRRKLGEFAEGEREPLDASQFADDELLTEEIIEETVAETISISIDELNGEQPLVNGGNLLQNSIMGG